MHNENLPEIQTNLEGFAVQYNSSDVGSIEDLNRVMQLRQNAGALYQVSAGELSRDSFGFKAGEVKVDDVKTYDAKTEDGHVWFQKIYLNLPEQDAKIAILIPSFSKEEERKGAYNLNHPERSVNVYSSKELEPGLVDRVVGQLALFHSMYIGDSESTKESRPKILFPELFRLGDISEYTQAGKNAIIQRTYPGFDDLSEEERDPEYQRPEFRL